MTEMRKIEAAVAARSGMPSDPIARASERLMEQVHTLDEMFVSLAAHAADRLPEWPGFAQAYVRLALRAQSNYRASLATLIDADREARRMQDAADTE